MDISEQPTRPWPEKPRALPRISDADVATDLDRQLREAWAASHRVGTVRRDWLGDAPPSANR